MSPYTRVEGADDLAGQLQVGRLVLAHRHVSGVVDGDVGGLEHRVGQQRVVDVIGLRPLLVLERGRPLDPGDRCHRRQQPHQLDVLRSVRLAEQHGTLGVQAQRQQPKCHLVGVAADGIRVVGRRQGVVVDDAVDRVVGLLHRDVVPERAQPVADMRQPGWLHAAEDPGTRRRVAGERWGWGGRRQGHWIVHRWGSTAAESSANRPQPAVPWYDRW